MAAPWDGFRAEQHVLGGEEGGVEQEEAGEKKEVVRERLLVWTRRRGTRWNCREVKGERMSQKGQRRTRRRRLIRQTGLRKARVEVRAVYIILRIESCAMTTLASDGQYQQQRRRARIRRGASGQWWAEAEANAEAERRVDHQLSARCHLCDTEIATEMCPRDLFAIKACWRHLQEFTSCPQDIRCSSACCFHSLHNLTLRAKKKPAQESEVTDREGDAAHR